MISFQNKAFVFFGGIHEPLAKFQIDFPNFQPKKIRQTHSDIVVEASDNLYEADAHYTSQTNAALLVSSADCMPIMIYCRQTHRVAAVHAGWRGIANKITEKMLQKLIASGSTKKQFQIWVGPHILQNSFAVDKPVCDVLTQAQHGITTQEYIQERNNKFYISLKNILISQIKFTCGSIPEMVFVEVDTKTNSDYHSFRRDPATKERNLSFICLLD